MNRKTRQIARQFLADAAGYATDGRSMLRYKDADAKEVMRRIDAARDMLDRAREVLKLKHKKRWVFRAPDGTGRTAKLTYGGQEIVGISSLSITVDDGDSVCLELHIAPGCFQAVLDTLGFISIQRTEDES